MIPSLLPPAQVLLTGATGFVGSSLHPALVDAGYRVRCLSRNVKRAQANEPTWDWTEGDFSKPETLAPALEGCDAAFYLVHSMGDHDPDYRRKEREEAEIFSKRARSAGLKRIVYLGGLKPQGEPSEHLGSRLEVGEALRNGPVPTVELRASMIVGRGSLSWYMVRDLAARLPAMVLPAWLKSRTEPVALRDVMRALVAALSVPLDASEAYDLPGPEALSALEILNQSAYCLKLKPPIMINVPFLTPTLSSHWLRFVTRADFTVARELVYGLTCDLLSRDGCYWEKIGHAERLTFIQAARLTLAEEKPDDLPVAITLMEKAMHLLRGRRGD